MIYMKKKKSMQRNASKMHMYIASTFYIQLLILNFLPILGTDKLPDNSKRGFPPNLVEKSTMLYMQRVMSIKKNCTHT